MKSIQGRDNILYDGHKYGQHRRKNSNYWYCTSSNQNGKRCGASIETKMIDGILKLRVKFPNHDCRRSQIVSVAANYSYW